MFKIYGIGTDENGRCIHYHKHCDVVALKCGKCGKYYACYECHDAMEDHPFAATGEDESYPVVCGSCQHQLTRDEYMLGRCKYCGMEFNPGCKLHYGIYFKQ